MNRYKLLIASVFLFFVVSCGKGGYSASENKDLSNTDNKIEKPNDLVEEIKKPSFQVTNFASGLVHPWGMAFLPNGDLLVTEKSGNLRIVNKEGVISEPVENLMPVLYERQGGLLDVVLDPDFVNNKMIYMSFSQAGDVEGTRHTAVAKGKLVGNRLEAVEVIWKQSESIKSGSHYGSRLVFDRDGYLFVTLGDRGSRQDDAQNLQSHIGKIVRIDTDGNPASGNPFLDRQDVLPDIWSYGHRNVQGAFLHPETGELWADEHGPRGGDEVNIVKAGKNYGWPVITYGINYNGTPITDKTEMVGMEQPVHYWDPSIATSGMLIYSGAAFPQWKNNVFVGALKLQHLNRLQLDENNKVIKEERLLLDKKQRVRAIEQGPDGAIYVATDNPDGQIFKISPAD